MNAPVNKPVNKLASPLAPVLPHLELDAAGASLLANAADASAGVELLEQAGRLQDAMRLIAHGLPKREAVWWACMCSRAVPDPAMTEHDMAALTAAETWVRKPDETAGRAAMTAAEATAFRSSEAWAAVAAFWSGGSMAPEGQPVVAPPGHLTGVAVAGAVMIAAVRIRPERAEARYARFLASARDIAAGGPGRIEPETG